ncbi:hypothetical protein WS62_15560 [Burkholderia sp. ABCPW 14]|nr:hypothetical protein WS62_15560 [Burkholderia sp. ABCPW 14]
MNWPTKLQMIEPVNDRSCDSAGRRVGESENNRFHKFDERVRPGRPGVRVDRRRPRPPRHPLRIPRAP